MKTAVLISGSGTNLQALIDACSSPDYPAEIAIVISNVPGAFGLKRAQKAGIPAKVIDHRRYEERSFFERDLQESLLLAGAEFICLAGFLRLLTDRFVKKWPDKIINIHPSLLPAFKGLGVQQAAIDAGVRFSGCSIHYVRPQMDSGPIIAQAVVPVWPQDTAETLAGRILKQEHKLYPLALRLIAEGRVKVIEERVEIEGYSPCDGVLINPSDC